MRQKFGEKYIRYFMGEIMSLPAKNFQTFEKTGYIRNDFLVFGAPAIQEAEINEVVASMKSGWLGTGPKVARFESEFRDYKDARYAVAVNSGTAALHLSMLVSGVKPGDEIITTPLTFSATINAIIHAGGTPVLADVDPVRQEPVPFYPSTLPAVHAIWMP